MIVIERRRAERPQSIVAASAPGEILFLGANLDYVSVQEGAEIRVLDEEGRSLLFMEAGVILGAHRAGVVLLLEGSPLHAARSNRHGASEWPTAAPAPHTRARPLPSQAQVTLGEAA
jgi:hypothetical protein